jgi:hypothetical protein
MGEYTTRCGRGCNWRLQDRSMVGRKKKEPYTEDAESTEFAEERKRFRVTFKKRG